MMNYVMDVLYFTLPNLKVFNLRHAAVYALHRIGAPDEIWAHAGDPSRSVRLAVLLTSRQTGDPRIEKFLDDEDGLLVIEAARAIYDVPIDAAMPALAGLATSIEAADPDDLQTSQALHRRIIGANVRLRSEAGATALARYAADENQLERLRKMALEALGSYSKPPLRDLTMGFYRPLEDASSEILVTIFRNQGRALVDSSLSSRALEIASEIGEIPLDDEELVEIASNASKPAKARASALEALSARPENAAIRATAEAALGDQEPEVRIAARDLLYAMDPAAGLEAFIDATDIGTGHSVGERKHAWRQMGEVDDPVVQARLREALDSWTEGKLEVAIALEAFEAASKQSDSRLASRAKAMMAPGFDALVDDRRWALEGGDAKVGERVFQTYGDCQRCHGGGEGHGAGVGPVLAGVSRRGADYVLESILDPQAQIAPGFASVVVTRQDGSIVSGLLLDESEESLTISADGVAPRGDGGLEIPRGEIASVSDPLTGMPPIGVGLEPQSLRDVVAYVMSLE